MTNKIFSCRTCGCENLKDIISLGKQHVTNFVSDKTEQGEKHELDLVLCDPTNGGCGLLQSRHNTPPELMWGDQYWYKSAISSTIRKDLLNVVYKSMEMIPIEDGDYVVDIGANDGTLLEFHNEHLNKIGFEPSKNVAKEAEAKGLKIINDFFNAESFMRECGDNKAKLITAVSMFYDLEDPNTFMEDIVSILHKRGLFVIQQNYLISMLEKNAFDNICHEHREYYSLYSLKKLLEKYNLEIFDAVESDINGGSIRTYIKFKGCSDYGNPISYARVKRIENKELELGINNLKFYYDFVDRIKNIKKRLLEWLEAEKAAGRPVYIYGASTRGNVILQYFGLTTDLITAAVDMNPDKWGKYTVGSMIPIVRPEVFRKANPDNLLIMTWHFADEIMKQEEEWHKNGGTFIVPLPKLKIYIS